MTPGQSARLKARRAMIADAIRRAAAARGADPSTVRVRGGLVRAALRDARRAMPAADTNTKTRNRAVAVYAGDGPASDGTVVHHKSTGRFFRLGTVRDAGGRIGDPALALSYRLRGALQSDRQRLPGVCRILDPTTGAVLREIDPLTRREIIRPKGDA